MKSFTLEVITQEQHLLTETVTSLTLPTQTGEITVLADHQPLFTKLQAGEMTYTTNAVKHYFAVTGGFVDVSARNITTVLADSAIRSEQINLQEAQKAVAAAQQALQSAPDQKTTLKIEAELRAALLMTKVAKKHQAHTY